MPEYLNAWLAGWLADNSPILIVNKFSTKKKSGNQIQMQSINLNKFDPKWLLVTLNA